MNKSLIYSCVLCCLGLFLISSQLCGQSAIRVGYVGGWYQSQNLKETVNRWSDQNTTLEKLSPFGFSNGIDIGYRKRSDDISYSLSYSIGLGGSSTAIDNTNELKINFFHHMVGAGLATHINAWAIGTNVLYNQLNISGKFEPQDKQSLDRLAYFSSRVYLSYTLKGSGTQRLALEPFVDIPWSSGESLDELTSFLSVTDNQESSTPLIFGLRVVLLNGSF